MNDIGGQTAERDNNMRGHGAAGAPGSTKWSKCGHSDTGRLGRTKRTAWETMRTAGALVDDKDDGEKLMTEQGGGLVGGRQHSGAPVNL